MSKLGKITEQLNKDAKAEIAAVGVVIDDPPRLSTNILKLDIATGGGVPEGRMAVFYGPESSAKTTAALKTVRSAQLKYPAKTAVYIDTERSVTRSWVQRCGVDPDKLLLVKPVSAEQAVDAACAYLEEGEEVSILVFDSLAALSPKQEVQKLAEEDVVGRAGILINKLYRKGTHAMGKSMVTYGCSPTAIFINQIRMQIGVRYGSPEIMPGGPSFKFASSLTVRFYGKDEFVKEISTKLPAYKSVSFILQKWKVPVAAREGKFLLALIDNPDLKLRVGDAYDLGTMKEYLKAFEFLQKVDKKGWAIVDSNGEILAEAKTQDKLFDAMVEDDALAAKVRAEIIGVVLKRGDLIDPDA